MISRNATQLYLLVEICDNSHDSVFCVGAETIFSLLDGLDELCLCDLMLLVVLAFTEIVFILFLVLLLRLNESGENFENSDWSSCLQAEVGVHEAEGLLTFIHLSMPKDVLRVVLLGEDVANNLGQRSFLDCRDSCLRLTQL